MSTTTMKVKPETLRWLHALKRPGESLDDVLERIKGDVEPVNVLETLRSKMQADAEARAKEAYLTKIRAYNEAHQAEADEARRVLGIDLKPGQSVKALDETKWKKRL